MPDSADPVRHEMTWDGPFGGSYVVRCSCGWAKNTFAATRETSIDSTWRTHLPSEHSDGPGSPRWEAECEEFGCHDDGAL